MQHLAYPSEKEEALLNFDETQGPMTSLDSHAGYASQPELIPSASRPSVSQHLEVEDKVKRAEEQLAELQARRQKLEQEKEELQILSSRRQSFTEGKAEVVQVLSEALPELRDEADEAQRRAEFLRQMREVFSQHLEVLKTVKPEDWDENEIKFELERSSSALDDAKSEIERFEERLGNFSGGAVTTSAGRRSGKMRPAEVEFARWMKMGFAFALPAMIFIAFTLVVTYLVVTQ